MTPRDQANELFKRLLRLRVPADLYHPNIMGLERKACGVRVGSQWTISVIFYEHANEDGKTISVYSCDEPDWLGEYRMHVIARFSWDERDELLAVIMEKMSEKEETHT